MSPSAIKRPLPSTNCNLYDFGIWCALAQWKKSNLFGFSSSSFNIEKEHCVERCSHLASSPRVGCFPIALWRTPTSLASWLINREA